MASSRDASKREVDEARAKAKRLEFYMECVDRPLKYLVHDVDAHDSTELQELRDEHGWGALGRYWHLMELLASRAGHFYDVSRPNGWRRLAQEMEFGRDEQGVADCQTFVGMLVGLALLSPEAFDKDQVRSNRVDRTASSSAREYANKRYATWCREQNRS